VKKKQTLKPKLPCAYKTGVATGHARPVDFSLRSSKFVVCYLNRIIKTLLFWN